MNAIKEIIENQMPQQNFDCIAVANIDFIDNEYECVEFQNGKFKTPNLIFDLASLTKPLTLSFNYILHQNLFDENMLLLLNHQAGLPMGGRISKDGWREYISSFQIKKSETLYSDYSALRLMIELEKKSKKSFIELCREYLPEDIVFWKEIDEKSKCVITGYRNKGLVQGEVHDPNCYVLSEFVSHAGLFSTIDSFSKFLIEIQKAHGFIELVEKQMQNPFERFVLGFDTATGESTLAGKGHSEFTFGHLGFTGVSFWIDAKTKKAQVILTNATKNYWYQRQNLNDLRRSLGEHF